MDCVSDNLMQNNNDLRVEMSTSIRLLYGECGVALFTFGSYLASRGLYIDMFCTRCRFVILETSFKSIYESKLIIINCRNKSKCFITWERKLLAINRSI